MSKIKREVDKLVREICLERFDAAPEDLTYEQVEPIIDEAQGQVEHDYEINNE